VKTLAVVAVLGGLMACGPSNPDVALDYIGETVSRSELATELSRGEYAIWADDPETRVAKSVRNLGIRLWAGSEPATEDELQVARMRIWVSKTRRCIQRRLMDRFHDLGDIELAAREYFDSHPGRFDEPERFRLQMVFIARDTPDGESLADRVLVSVSEDPERFPELAATHSASQTAWNDGITDILDGRALHPDLRAAARAGRDGRPVAVTLDRGWYVFRVLDAWDPIVATYQMARPHVMRALQREIEISSRREALESAGPWDMRTVDEPPNHRDPLLDPRTEALNFRGTIIHAGAVARVSERGFVSGPSLRAAVDDMVALAALANHLACTPSDSEIEPTREAVAESRVPDIVPDLLAQALPNEIVDFHELHRSALVEPASYTVDLAVFPYKSADLFEDLEGYSSSMDALAEHDVWIDDSDDDRLLFEDITLSESEVAAFDPDLVPGLRTMAPDRFSEYVTSDSVGAFLLIRLIRRTPPRELGIETPADRAAVARAFVSTKPDEALDLTFELLRNQGDLKVHDSVILEVAAPFLNPDSVE
jgi:hypothetical protein